MFKRPKGGKPVPRNTYAVGVARETIEFLAPVAQRQLHNAITGDGRHCLLYIPKVGGVRCTCNNEDPLDIDGKMNPEVMHSLLNSSGLIVDNYTTPKRENPNTAHMTDNPTKVTNGFKVTDASPVHNTSAKKPNGFTAKVFNIEQLDDENFDADDFDIDLDVRMDGKKKIPTLQNGYVPTVNMATTSCPICLGIGWVGGFDLYGGTRIVLSASSASRFNGCKLVDGSPDYVAMTKGSTIVYDKVMLPAGVERLDEIALWSGRDKVAFKMRLDGNEISVADFGNLFDGSAHSLEFEPLFNVNVTHATLQYGISDIMIDVSKKSITTNSSLYDQQTEVTLVLPAVTQKELKGAIVYDSTDNKLYRVTSTSSAQTQGGWIQSLDLDARIVQPYELTNLLPKMNIHKIKRFGGSFNNTSVRPKYF